MKQLVSIKRTSINSFNDLRKSTSWEITCFLAKSRIRLTPPYFSQQDSGLVYFSKLVKGPICKADDTESADI